MLGARLEDLALGLCHGILDLDNITGLWSARIQSKLRRSPVSQLLTISLRPVHDEHPGLLVQIRQRLFKLPLPTVRGEVKTLDSRIDRFSSSVDDKLPPSKRIRPGLPGTWKLTMKTAFCFLPATFSI